MTYIRIIPGSNNLKLRKHVKIIIVNHSPQCGLTSDGVSNYDEDGNEGGEMGLTGLSGVLKLPVLIKSFFANSNDSQMNFRNFSNSDHNHFFWIV